MSKRMSVLGFGYETDIGSLPAALPVTRDVHRSPCFRSSTLLNFLDVRHNYYFHGATRTVDIFFFLSRNLRPAYGQIYRRVGFVKRFCIEYLALLAFYRICRSRRRRRRRSPSCVRYVPSTQQLESSYIVQSHVRIHSIPIRGGQDLLLRARYHGEKQDSAVTHFQNPTMPNE